MTATNLPTNLCAVNPEDTQQLLRDLADCRRLLASERHQSAKVRAENKDLKEQLERATSSEKRWILKARDSMREGQFLREDLLEQQKSLRHRRLIPAHYVEALVEN